MQADVDALVLGQGGGLGVGPDAEGDDDGVGGRGQQHVGFADRAHAGVDDLDLDLLGAQLFQLFAQGLDRAAHVGLQNQRQLLDRAGLELLVQLVEGEAGAGGQGSLAHLLPAVGGHLLGADFVGHHLEAVAGFRQRRQAQNFDGGGGTGLRQHPPAVVEHGAHLAEDRTDDEGVADAQGAVLDEHGSHRAAAAVELGFEHGARGGQGGLGAQLLHVGHQQDHLEQLVQIGLLLGGDVDHDRVAAPVFRDQAAVGQLLLDALGERPGLVDLVHCHHQGHLGGAGVVDGLERLRHHPVVGRHHQHHHVGHLGAAGAHAGEGLVAGRVDEDDLAAADLHLVSANVLGDAAGLAGGDAGFADGVEQRSFAVVDVAHDGDHRGARRPLALRFRRDLLLQGLLFERNHRGGGVEVLGDFAGELDVERLVDGGEHAAVEQHLDDVLGADVELLGQLLDGDALGDGDLNGRAGSGSGGRLAQRRLALAGLGLHPHPHRVHEPALALVEALVEMGAGGRFRLGRRLGLVDGFAGRHRSRPRGPGNGAGAEARGRLGRGRRRGHRTGRHAAQFSWNSSGRTGGGRQPRAGAACSAARWAAARSAASRAAAALAAAACRSASCSACSAALK